MVLGFVHREALGCRTTRGYGSSFPHVPFCYLWDDPRSSPVFVADRLWFAPGRRCQRVARGRARGRRYQAWGGGYRRRQRGQMWRDGRRLVLVARSAGTPDVFSNSYRRLLLLAAPLGGFEPRRR